MPDTSLAEHDRQGATLLVASLVAACRGPDGSVAAVTGDPATPSLPTVAAAVGWALTRDHVYPQLAITDLCLLLADTPGGTDIGVLQAALAITGRYSADDITLALSATDPDPGDAIVYWASTHAVSQIRRTRITGSALSPVGPPILMPGPLAADLINDKLYCGTAFDPGAIWRMNFDGSMSEIVIPNVSNTHSLAVDPLNGFIFWCDRPSGSPNCRLQRATIDGGNQTTLAVLPNNPCGITLDPKAKRLFWTRQDAGTALWSLVSGDYDGGDVRTLSLDGNGSGVAIRLDPTRRYVYLLADGGLFRYPVDGGAREQVAADGSITFFSGLDFVPGKLRPVWSNGADAIRTALTLGSAPPALVAQGVDQPNGVAVIPAAKLPARLGARIPAGSFLAANPHPAYLFGTGDFTVTASFQTGQPGTLVSSKSTEGGSPACAGWLLVLQAGGLFKFATDNGFGFHEGVSGQTSALDGSWHTVTAVRRQGQLLSIWYDGAQLQVLPRGSLPPPLDVSGASRLVVGSTDQVQETFRSFDGTISSVAMWNRALEAEEIGVLSARAARPESPGIVALWQLAGDLSDSSANGNALAATGPIAMAFPTPVQRPLRPVL